MKVTIRVPSHHLGSPKAGARTPPREDEEDKFINRPCYVFNPALRSGLNDARCSHCRHYLTSACPHIEEFLDDVDEMSPD